MAIDLRQRRRFLYAGAAALLCVGALGLWLGLRGGDPSPAEPRDPDAPTAPASRERVTGRVLRAEGSSPLADVRVVLTPTAGSPGAPTRTARSDAGGRFAFEDLPPPPYELLAERDGYETQRLWIAQPLDEPLTLTLAAVGMLEVELAEAQGDIEVWVSGLSVWPARQVHVPAGTTHAKIGGLVDGTVRAWAHSPTQVGGPSEPVEVRAGEVARVRLRLSPAARLTGQVRSSDDAPIPDAQVQVLPPEPGLPAQELTTDARGRFEGGVFFASSAHVWVRAEGFVDRVVEALPGQPLSVRLRPTVSVQGQVVNADGAPVAGARVWATGRAGESAHSSWRALLSPGTGELGVLSGDIPRVPMAMAGAQAPALSTRTDAGGHFTLTGLTREDVAVHAERAGLAHASVSVPDVAAVEEPLRIVLREGGRVYGTVRDPRGFEVQGVDVRLASADGLHERWSVSDDRGEFRFDDVYGPTRVQAFEHGAPIDRCDVNVDTGDAADCALVVGEPRAVLDVHVEDERGQPVPAARLSLHRDQAGGAPRDLSRQRLTGPDGHAVFASLPLAQHTLEVEASGYVRPPARSVDTRRVGEVRLQLARAGAVAGTVVDSLGQTVAGARVRARDVLGSTRTGAQGEFVLDGLPPGSVTLQASLAGVRSEPLSATVRRGEQVEGVRLALRGRAPAEPVATAPGSEEPVRDTEEPQPPAPTVAEAPSVLQALEVAQAGTDSVVRHVGQGSPAAVAGFREGDVITHIDGEPVLSAGQARGMLRDPPGQLAQVRVERGSKALKLRFRRPTLR